MRRWLVACNSLCMDVESVQAWVKALYPEHLDTTLLVYAAIQMHPAYQTRYLKAYLQWVRLVKCPMFDPRNDLNRKALDAYILADAEDFLWRVLDAEEVVLLSPKKDSWPVAPDFKLSVWLAALGGDQKDLTWNGEAMGLKRLDKAGILEGKEETLRWQLEQWFRRGKGVF